MFTDQKSYNGPLPHMCIQLFFLEHTLHQKNKFFSSIYQKKANEKCCLKLMRILTYLCIVLPLRSKNCPYSWSNCIFFLRLFWTAFSLWNSYLWMNSFLKTRQSWILHEVLILNLIIAVLAGGSGSQTRLCLVDMITLYQLLQ